MSDVGASAALPPQAARSEYPDRISGVDSIRFVCALIVVLGHLGPIGHGVFGSFGALLEKFTAVAFNGPAAVIAFFIISGFCIHFPVAKAPTVKRSIPAFYARRFIRIGLPVLAVLALYWLSGVHIQYPTFGVLWSIICEAIYYLLYPALLVAAQRIGWGKLLGVTVAVSAVTAVILALTIGVIDDSYPALGLFTWVIGLPVWVSGCLLAERWPRLPKVRTPTIWLIRAAVYVSSVVLRIVYFHAEGLLGNNILLLSLLALGMYFWIGAEIRYFSDRKPWRVLEWAGSWSYALYIVHPIAVHLLYGSTNAAGAVPAYLATLSAALLGSVAFFYLVEKPSHILAQATGRRIGGRRPVQGLRLET